MNASPQSFPQGAERGFSLVEIMIALGIFSFAAVAILGLLPLALHLARESQNGPPILPTRFFLICAPRHPRWH